MATLPTIGSRKAFASWRASSDPWRAAVEDIARAEGVPTGALVPFKTGTNLVVDLDGRFHPWKMRAISPSN